MATKDKKVAPVDDWEASPGGEDDWEEAGNASQKRARSANKPLDLMAEYKKAGEKFVAPEFAVDLLHGGMGAIDTVTGRNIRYSPAWQEAMEEAEAESPRSTSVGKGVGALGLGTASALLAPQTLPWVAGMGAGVGAFEKPGIDLSLREDLTQRLKNAGTGVAVNLGMLGLGKGASKVGDIAMQRSVVSRDYIPGMGNRMAKEGLIGSKGMMRTQIERDPQAPSTMVSRLLDRIGLTNKLPAREAALQPEISQMTGQISAVPSVDAISREGALLVPRNPNIPISSGNQASVNAVHQRALEAASRGNLDPLDALDVARKIDRAAYDTQIPAGRFAKKLDRLDSGAIRSELKDQADAQGLKKVRDLLGSEEALITARGALDQRESPYMALLKRAALMGTMGGGTYYATRDPWAALAMAGASTPAGLSTIGQIGTRAGQLSPVLSPAAIKALLDEKMGIPQEAQ